MTTKDCSYLYNCCNCGGNDCGCHYCFGCNACENCQEDKKPCLNLKGNENEQESNHGKMKAWRKPEIGTTDDGESVLVKQRPHVRRKTKGHSVVMKAGLSPLLYSMFDRVGLINKTMPQV